MAELKMLRFLLGFTRMEEMFEGGYGGYWGDGER